MNRSSVRFRQAAPGQRLKFERHSNEGLHQGLQSPGNPRSSGEHRVSRGLDKSRRVYGYDHFRPASERDGLRHLQSSRARARSTTWARLWTSFGQTRFCTRTTHFAIANSSPMSIGAWITKRMTHRRTVEGRPSIALLTVFHLSADAWAR